MAAQNKKIKIILTGGGTMGSVTPLLTIKKIVEKGIGGEVSFLWIGTKNGVEKEAVNKEGIKYYGISAGKLRRYWDKKNFSDIIKISKGFLEAKKILKSERPDLIITAGSFVSVPVAWAAKLLRIPVIIIQSDYRPGLANKIMAPTASMILVTLKKSLKDYSGKGIYLGAIFTATESFKSFGDLIAVNDTGIFNNNLQTVLVLGGGTGSQKINELILQIAPKLNQKCNLIVIAGKNKVQNTRYKTPNTKIYDFLPHPEILRLIQQSDIVISRCGMGALTELSYFGKPTILIPMPDSHQEENAKIFQEENAAIVLNQKTLTPEKLEKEIVNLLVNNKKQEELTKNIKKVIKIANEEELIKIISKEFLFNTSLFL